MVRIKTHVLRFVILLGIILLCYDRVTAQSQEMVVHLANGETTKFQIVNKPRITFGASHMLIFSSNQRLESKRKEVSKITFEGLSTSGEMGIEEQKSETSNANAIYYDLQGRRICNPTGKGIYVKNGKKMVIK